MRVLPALLLVLAFSTGVAGCADGDDPSSVDDVPSPDGSIVEDVPTVGEDGTVSPTVDVSSEASPAAATTASDLPTPDPSGAAETITESSDLAVALGELPLPSGTEPFGEAVTEGSTVSQIFRVQGIASADEVLTEDYLGELEDAGWEGQDGPQDRGDGVAASFFRDDLDLLLVTQDGPAGDPENAVLNVVLSSQG